MKRILFVLSLIFTVLTFVGAGYVLYTDGQANAGYAVIPLAMALACISGYRTFKKENTAYALKKWLIVKQVINTAIGVSVGCLIGRVTWIIVDYNAHPDLYASHSAPWYTPIIVAAVFWGIAILLEVLALLFVRHKLNANPVIGIIENNVAKENTENEENNFN